MTEVKDTLTGYSETDELATRGDSPREFRGARLGVINFETLDALTETRRKIRAEQLDVDRSYQGDWIDFPITEQEEMQIFIGVRGACHFFFSTSNPDVIGTIAKIGGFDIPADFHELEPHRAFTYKGVTLEKEVDKKGHDRIVVTFEHVFSPEATPAVILHGFLGLIDTSLSSIEAESKITQNTINDRLSAELQRARDFYHVEKLLPHAAGELREQIIRALGEEGLLDFASVTDHDKYSEISRRIKVGAEKSFNDMLLKEIKRLLRTSPDFPKDITRTTEEILQEMRKSLATSQLIHNFYKGQLAHNTTHGFSRLVRESEFNIKHLISRDLGIDQEMILVTYTIVGTSEPLYLLGSGQTPPEVQVRFRYRPELDGRVIVIPFDSGDPDAIVTEFTDWQRAALLMGLRSMGLREKKQEKQGPLFLREYYEGIIINPVSPNEVSSVTISEEAFNDPEVVKGILATWEEKPLYLRDKNNQLHRLVAEGQTLEKKELVSSEEAYV